VGLAVCEHLASQGRKVAILDLDGDAAARVAQDLSDRGAQACSVAVDVADRDAVDRAFVEVRDVLGPIHILVTSAAVSGFTRFEDITLAQWQHTLTVNLTGTFNCAQAAIRDMKEARWGRIVTISSAAGQTGSVRQADYSASKGGVIALTKTIALEYARKGITANTIPPFAADTPMLRGEQEAQRLPGDDLLTQMIPAGRLGTTDEIAAVCAFLCSDEASYLTGQVIGVNGGAVT
jgi:NAD(P)-dependent dehydrogenase (short-subunit alcohol dehydrogenase family)